MPFIIDNIPPNHSCNTRVCITCLIDGGYKPARSNNIQSTRNVKNMTNYQIYCGMLALEEVHENGREVGQRRLSGASARGY